MPIPEFKRSYRLRVSLTDESNSNLQLTGIDSNGDCYVLFKSMKISGLNAAPVVYP